MAKRRFSEANLDLPESSSKRAAFDHTGSLLALSDEILVQVFAQLSVSDLANLQTVSKRVKRVSGDRTVWRAQYYNRFVKPRASGLSKDRQDAFERTMLGNVSRWLDDEMVEEQDVIDWKQRYQMKHNWSCGGAKVLHISLSDQPRPSPQYVACLRAGFVYIADSINGLRAWYPRSHREVVAKQNLEQRESAPTLVVVDVDADDKNIHNTIVAFDDGSLQLFAFNTKSRRFTLSWSHPASSNGAVVACTLFSQYLATVSANGTLSFYIIDFELSSVRLAMSYHSTTVSPPLALTLRPVHGDMVMSIVYSRETVLSGWTAEIQDFHISAEGEEIGSHVCTTIGEGYAPVSAHSGTATSEPVMGAPVALSYNHPYLLITRADNTMALHSVHSTPEMVSIGQAKRVFGHTSGICAAHINRRGKAVSACTRGGEVRSWELEGQQNFIRDKSLDESKFSVKAYARSIEGPGVDAMNSKTSTLVGFDERSVVLIRERGEDGLQTLTVYDFN